MEKQPESTERSFSLPYKLKSLKPEQILHIDQVLASLGEYGEVRLIVQRGELRYINRVESFKVWKDETEP